MAGDYLPENVPVILIVMGSAGFVISVYHLIALCLCNHHVTNQNPRRQRQQQPDRQPDAGEAATAAGLNESTCPVALLIPAHKYEKKIGVADGEDGTCAVCLGDFEEGEELRTLPACVHSFHVPCIDAWLHSHSSCPICRASATPSPAVAVLPHRPVPDGDLNAHHSIDMVQIALVQNGFVRR